MPKEKAEPILQNDNCQSLTRLYALISGRCLRTFSYKNRGITDVYVEAHFFQISIELVVDGAFSGKHRESEEPHFVLLNDHGLDNPPKTARSSMLLRSLNDEGTNIPS